MLIHTPFLAWFFVLFDVTYVLVYYCINLYPEWVGISCCHWLDMYMYIWVYMCINLQWWIIKWWRWRRWRWRRWRWYAWGTVSVLPTTVYFWGNIIFDRLSRQSGYVDLSFSNTLPVVKNDDQNEEKGGEEELSGKYVQLKQLQDEIRGQPTGKPLP